jgi:hypothetical protein
MEVFPGWRESYGYVIRRDQALSRSASVYSLPRAKCFKAKGKMLVLTVGRRNLCVRRPCWMDKGIDIKPLIAMLHHYGWMLPVEDQDPTDNGFPVQCDAHRTPTVRLLSLERLVVLAR